MWANPFVMKGFVVFAGGVMKRLVVTLVAAFCLYQAQAGTAPWWRWESQVDGRLVCSQWPPGDGWKKFAGPYSNGACRYRFAVIGNQAPDNRRPTRRLPPRKPVSTGFFMISQSWFGTCFLARIATASGKRPPVQWRMTVDKMLYVAMTGASQNALAQKAHANNLANISTNGFQRDLEQARSMPVFGDSFPSRAFAMTERPATDFSEGPMVETGRDLDVTVTGKGFIAVQAPDGSEAYVRTGSLNIDALGVLRAGNGMPVIGNGGPIAIPPEQKVEVGADGTISIRSMGEDPRVMAEVDRIKLVNPDTKGLTKGLDGLIHTRDGQPADADVNVRVVSGFLEGSNVNAVEEMTSVLALSRQFELHVKMMNAAKEGDEAMARVLQIG